MIQPVVMLEHKGLYWSKIKGTEDAKNNWNQMKIMTYLVRVESRKLLEENISKGKSLTVSYLWYGSLLGNRGF